MLANKLKAITLTIFPSIFFASYAVASDVPDFTEGCLQNNNLGRATCQCLATRAKTELSPKAYAMLVATFYQDSATMDQLRPQLTFEDSIAMGTFMQNNAEECDHGAS
ncbi:MAG: hypothetical protein AAF652_02840 [Cyanobacteria bacterium P01_C01_bin.72]